MLSGYWLIPGWSLLIDLELRVGVASRHVLRWVVALAYPPLNPARTAAELGWQAPTNFETIVAKIYRDAIP